MASRHLSGNTRYHARIAVGGTLAVLLAATAACGSSTTSGRRSETSKAGRAQAEAVVKQYSHRPTGSGAAKLVSTPIGKPVPAGKKVYFVSCGAPACDAIGQIVVQAAKVVNWTAVVLHTDGSPQQIQNAWAQIVREKPAGAIIAGTPLSEAQPYIKEAQANGTAVVADSVTDPLGSKNAAGVIWETFVPQQFGVLGKILAAQILADGGSSKPGALYLNIPDISISSVATGQFLKYYKKWCKGCEVAQLNLGLSSIANAPTQIASYLRSHPDIKFLASTNDGSFVGLTTALKAAGVTGIKYYGASPVSANLQAIKDGEQSGTVAIGFYEQMYAAMDAIIRHTVGVPVVPGTRGQPFTWALDRNNLAQTGYGTSSFPKSGLFPLVSTAQSHYRQLWGQP